MDAGAKEYRGRSFSSGSVFFVALLLFLSLVDWVELGWLRWDPFNWPVCLFMAFLWLVFVFIPSAVFPSFTPFIREM